jgi:hypothetical protein
MLRLGKTGRKLALNAASMLNVCHYRYGTVITAVLAALLLSIPVCFSQAISGDLVGTISDPTGATIAGVTVTATNTATNIKYTSTTNASGQYRVSNLPPGTYTVSATEQGFATQTLENVAVQLNQIATANMTLQISEATTTVNVVEAPTVIDTTTAQIQQTYTTKEAQELPVTSVGSGILNLSLLESGVTSSGGVGMGVGPSVGGQRPRNNNFTIEGVDNNSKSVTGPQVVVVNDSVAEFTLLQNQYSPEYGHSSGGQFNTIVKGGTNELHGMIYDYLRNRNLNAVDQSFANKGIYSNPRYDQNRLGANVGGPIRHDKWFFFASFEYNPLGQASTTGSDVYAPTTAGYATLAVLPGISQTNLSILKQYATATAVSPGAPAITIGGTSVPTGQVPIVGPNFSNSYFGVLSSDYNFSDKDQIRGRFIYNKATTIDTGATLPLFYTTVPTTNHLGTLAWYHTFGATLTNEFRLGYNRQNQNFPVGNQQFPGLGGVFPNLEFNDLGLQLGPNPNFPQYNVQNLYQGSENLTLIKGSHTFKFGTELRRYIAPTSFTQRSRGDYEYTHVSSYLLDVIPDYLAQRGVGNVVYYGDQIASYSYAQDTWRFRPNLTVNLGIRYEYTTVPQGERLQTLNAIANVPGLITFQRPQAQTTAWAPRVGIAYSPGKSGNTSIRAGFGMAYDVLFDNMGTLSLPPQLSTTVDVTGDAGGSFLATGGIPANASAGTLSAMDARNSTSAYIQNEVLPYTISWNAGIQHVFAHNYTIEIRYLGTRGVHLPTQMQINKQSPVTATQNIPTFLNAPSAATLASLPLTAGALRAMGNIAPQWRAAGFISPITSYTAQGNSLYNGLAVQVNRRFSNGLQFIGAYTWSHALDNSTAEFATTYLTPRRPQDFANFRPEWATSALDRRHRFTLTAMYDAPWFKGGNWFMRNLVGNWEIAPIYTYESPEYFTPQSGIDANLNGDSAPDRGIINPSGVAHTGTGVYGLTANGTRVNLTTPASADMVVAWVAINPNARYIQAGYGAYANSGRNLEPTRPINNVDLTLMKRFSVTERLHLELYGQAFNVFNHPQFVPGAVDDVGRISTFSPGSRSYVNVANPLFNNPVMAFSSSPRVLQIAAKFIW